MNWPTPRGRAEVSPAAAGRGTTRYVSQVARAIARDPTEALERVREKRAERHDARLPWTGYRPSPDAEEQLHRALGLPWPCPDRDEFAALWPHLTAPLLERGLAVGRGAFGGWDDGDPALVRAAWCLTRHLQPDVVVETGVARGLTTAAVLRALAANGTGHLWSIDLPPLAESGLSGETAAAVGLAERSRWTLCAGSSRKVLPDLLRELNQVDLFIHDSMHTSRNVSFELSCIWPHLRPGGAALIDDVERNSAFGRFTASHPDAPAFLRQSDDGDALLGCLLRPEVRVPARA